MGESAVHCTDPFRFVLSRPFLIAVYLHPNPFGCFLLIRMLLHLRLYQETIKHRKLGLSVVFTCKSV